VVDAADTAMYEAKRAGGNQPRHAGSDRIHSI
jgi:GGDEF domain-containing protein